MEKTFEAWQDYGNGRKKRRRRRSRAKKLPVVPPSWRPLSQRLSPNRSCFDSELKARWEGMSKAEKKEMLKEDRKMLKAWKIQRGKSTVAKLEYPFEAKPEDHCETPLKAFQDVRGLLTMVAKAMGKTQQELKIYDPWKMKEHLRKLGFQSVVNERVDFYKDVAQKTVPPYDVLVTHPPLSGNHVKQLLEFCVQSGKPYCILLPVDVRKAEYYVSTVGNQRKSRPMYVCPQKKYAFSRPGRGRMRKTQKTEASVVREGSSGVAVMIWYISVSPALSKSEALKNWRAQEPKAEGESDVRLCNSLKELPDTGWEGGGGRS